MISVETPYKTHNGKLLAIIEAFRTWHHYLEGCKYEILDLINYINLRCFMDTKSLSSKQVYWAQELFQYHFQIDYCQAKANAAVDALLRFPQKSQDEENELRVENGRIFHYLQNLLTNASLVELSLLVLSSFSLPSYLHQIFRYGTYVLPQLKEFWNLFQSKLLNENLYTVSIGSMRLRLYKLQAKEKQARKLRAN